MPLRVTQEAMGHSSPVLTARVYQEVEHFKTAEEIAKLPRLPDLRRSAAGRKAPIAKKTLDTAGDSADDVDAEVDDDGTHTHNHNDTTGCSPNGHRLPQQRIEPFCERPVDRCEVPDGIREIAGRLSSAVEQRFCKPPPPDQRPRAVGKRADEKARAIADLLESIAQVLRLEHDDGTGERPALSE